MSPSTGRPWPTDLRFLVDPSGAITGPSGRVLTPMPNWAGYLQISRYAEGKWYRPAVHIMVCETFHGPRPPGHDAAHHDGNKSNCSAENVGWKTPTENEADKVTHGTRAEGERHGCAVLTADQVREIRASREPARVFAERFGVGMTAVKDARAGRTWTCVR